MIDNRGDPYRSCWPDSWRQAVHSSSSNYWILFVGSDCARSGCMPSPHAPLMRGTKLRLDMFRRHRLVRRIDYCERPQYASTAVQSKSNSQIERERLFSRQQEHKSVSVLNLSRSCSLYS